ncbi:MAG: type I CRISPR-associated protein Cas7 [Nitrospirae bacterium]|nr:type I CRISPR-associated protein Cas7 [Candidatus Manganitrophaceae bacterium]
MATCDLHLFKHNSAFGNAPAHRLFEWIQAKLKDGVSVPRNLKK